MAVPELDPEENAHLREEMREAIRTRFHSRNRLAVALGVQGSSLGKFLKDGGAAKTTARKFAELMGKSYEEVLGHVADMKNGGQMRRDAPLAQAGAARGFFRPTPEAARKARVLLRQPPQNFSDEAIDIAEEDTFLTTQEAAARPGAVAEAWRHTILGSAAQLPLHPSPPSTVPPLGTRRSRMRAR